MRLWKYTPRRGDAELLYIFAESKLEAIIWVKNLDGDRWRVSGYQDLQEATPAEAVAYGALRGTPPTAGKGIVLDSPKDLPGYRAYLVDLGGLSLVFAANKEQAYHWVKDHDSVYIRRDNIRRATQWDVEYVIHGYQGESPDIAED